MCTSAPLTWEGTKGRTCLFWLELHLEKEQIGCGSAHKANVSATAFERICSVRYLLIGMRQFSLTSQISESQVKCA